VLDIPLAMHLLISRGIELFTAHRSWINHNYLFLSKTAFWHRHDRKILGKLWAKLDSFHRSIQDFEHN
jgi:hypothetical protein